MNNLRSRLDSQDVLLGTLITLDSPEVALLLQKAGFSWFFLDLEHSAILDLKSTQRIIEVLQPASYAVIRVPDDSETWIKHALDTGCDGIIVPHVSTAQQARTTVERAKYPPAGKRSVGIARAHGYGTSFARYLETSGESVAVIAQIEDTEGVENIHDILNVRGIDAVFVGPYDLSGSMGILGDLANPLLIEMIGRVRTACEESGVPLGIFCPSTAAARKEVDHGATLIAVGSDTGYVFAGGSAALTELQQKG
ncbi:aldolase/citrate lyase family protein [Streptosporangium sp. NPDC049046]|uniref:HpcH/HpaI aldolase family protein n=1 Tax=unclassified Streptosporangium TaxID=2632669 RepID=UPI0034456020